MKKDWHWKAIVIIAVVGMYAYLYFNIKGAQF
jgi:hypothetical protein